MDLTGGCSEMRERCLCGQVNGHRESRRGLSMCGLLFGCSLYLGWELLQGGEEASLRAGNDRHLLPCSARTLSRAAAWPRRCA